MNLTMLYEQNIYIQMTTSKAPSRDDINEADVYLVRIEMKSRDRYLVLKNRRGTPFICISSVGAKRLLKTSHEPIVVDYRNLNKFAQRDIVRSFPQLKSHLEYGKWKHWHVNGQEPIVRAKG